MAPIMAIIPKMRDRTPERMGSLLKLHENKIKGMANGMVTEEKIWFMPDIEAVISSKGKINKLAIIIPMKYKIKISPIFPKNGTLRHKYITKAGNRR
jgi:hypothetical protein